MSNVGNFKVAVVMLTFNQRDTTLRALRSFGETLDDSNVVVWDNGSVDGTEQAVREQFPRVHVHRHPTNLGVASGRNAGAELAIRLHSPTHLVFLDNDVVLRPGFVAALRGPFERDPQVGQTQGKLLYMDEPGRINDGGGCRINFWLGSTVPVGFKQLDVGQCEREAPCISCGGAMMVRTELFQRLGGFDAIFDPFGPEDLDFSLRLQHLGFRALYVPTAVALHAVNHTFGQDGYSSVYARSKVKHWLRFLRRHGTPLQKFGFAVVGGPLIGARLVVRELLRGNPAAIAGSVRGLVDAVRASRS